MDSLTNPTALAEMRAIEAANMPHTCDIAERVLVRGEGGGSAVVPTIVAAAVPCRLSQPTAVSGGPEGRGTMDTGRRRLIVPVGTVAPVDALVSVAGEDDAGAAWTWTGRITGTDAPRTNAVRVSLECVPYDPANEPAGVP